MAQPLLIEDSHVLWQAVDKVGSPPAWSANTNYKLGDVVVPTVIGPGQAALMFECVGFLAKSNVSQPVFPVTLGNKVVDSQAEWKAVDPAASPEALPYNQYFLISQDVVVS